MVRSLLRTALTLSALYWLAPASLADCEEKTAADIRKPGANAFVKQEARDALARFGKNDTSWKVRMEAWVRLMQAGPDAVPVLEDALKNESPAVRAVARQALEVMSGSAAIRKTATNYDLSKLDSARLGQIAPDFSLTDLSGRLIRLSQFRGKK